MPYNVTRWSHKQCSNTLSSIPSILFEANFDKNRGISIGQIRIGSAKKIWWKCSNGHEWQAQVRHRVPKEKGGRGCGCPSCKRKFSSLELLCYLVLKERWGDTEWQSKISGVEVDVVLPRWKTAIEIDGSYWHRDKEEKDFEKNRILENIGYAVIRVREKPLGTIGFLDIQHDVKDEKKEIALRVLRLVESLHDCREVRLDWQKVDSLYESIKKTTVVPEKSLAIRFPKIAAEFHLDKNSGLSPHSLSFGSRKRVWWKCSSGHEWVTSVSNRTTRSGTGTKCPYCSGNHVSAENCLALRYSELCSEWSANNAISPFEITPHSSRKVKWICECGAEYEMTVDARVRGQRCPVCRYRRMAETRKKNNIVRLLCRIAV